MLISNLAVINSNMLFIVVVYQNQVNKLIKIENERRS